MYKYRKDLYLKQGEMIGYCHGVLVNFTRLYCITTNTPNMGDFYQWTWISHSSQMRLVGQVQLYSKLWLAPHFLSLQDQGEGKANLWMCEGDCRESSQLIHMNLNLFGNDICHGHIYYSSQNTSYCQAYQYGR